MFTKPVLAGALALALAGPAQAYDWLNDWPTKFKTDDGVEFGVKGNFQYDLNAFSDEVSNPNIQTWRRKETYLYAKKNGVWELTAGYDFQSRLWVDAFFRIFTKNAGDFRIGQSKTWVGYDEGTVGSGATTFLERPLPVQAVNQGRRIGLDWTYEKVPGVILQAGYYSGGDLNGDNDGNTWAGHVVWNPVKTDKSVVHLGLAGSVEERDDEVARFRARPEANLTALRFVDTGNLAGTDRINRFGVEGAWAEGPFSVVGEWLQISANRDNRPDYVGDGYYVYGSWVVTGESRAYKSGAFGNVKPANPWGAVELALRYSQLDLNDGLVKGGKQHDWTFGANWYLGTHLKLQANYIRATSERGNLKVDPNITEVRAQVYF